jgi:hypothetical protein
LAPQPNELMPTGEALNTDTKHDVIATAVVLGRVTDFLQVN